MLKLFGIDRALSHYCSEFGSSHEMDIRFTSNIGSERLSEKAELCFYRIAQESLHNIAKHANTTSADVSLVKKESEYRLSIRDKGQGFNPAERRESGLGLLSMKERIETLEGKLTIRSKVNHGTIITARLPADQKSAIGAESVSDGLAESVSAER